MLCAGVAAAWRGEDHRFNEKFRQKKARKFQRTDKGEALITLAREGPDPREQRDARAPITPIRCINFLSIKKALR